jgi:hypothetical protein
MGVGRARSIGAFATANSHLICFYPLREREPAALRELKRSLRRCGMKDVPIVPPHTLFDHGQCDDIGT